MAVPGWLLLELGILTVPAMVENLNRRWGRGPGDQPLPRFASGDGCFYFRDQARWGQTGGGASEVVVYRGTEAAAPELLEALDRLELVEALAAACLGDATAARVAANSIRQTLYWSGLERLESVVLNPEDAQLVFRWAGGGWWRPGDGGFLCTADERITRVQTAKLLEALLADLADRCDASKLEAVKRDVAALQAARRSSSSSSAAPSRWWMVGAALALVVGALVLRGAR